MRRDTEESLAIRRTPSPVVVSIVASAVTSTVLFFVWRALVPTAGSSAAATPAAEAAPDQTEVPNLVGAKPEQARALLDPRGLLLVLEDEREDPNAPAGTILAQTPLAGSRARRGAEVRAIVSRGTVTPRVPPVTGLSVDQAAPPVAQKGIDVPNVTRMRLSKAEKLLAAAGLKVGAKRYAYDENYGGNVVLRQKPPAATTAAPGTAIDLTVNESD